jgi:two-component system, OmpR family, alkaline phosphatase synthesis response regulator PhoP
MSYKILLVEDEPGLRLTLSDRLAMQGYEVIEASDGEAGWKKGLEGPLDLVLLDVGLPKLDGFEVLRRWRAASMETPVLMLTARGETVDKVSGLRMGADDYMVKPFDSMELLARVEALLRRAAVRRGAVTSEGVEFGSVRVDLKASKVFVRGEAITLSLKEFQLLKYLAERVGEVVSREELLEKVWGWSQSVNTRTVDVHVTWLRQKLEETSKSPEHLITVRGMGYKLVI